MKTRKGFLIQRGKTWYAVWSVKGKRFVKTTGQTIYKDAEKELAKFIQPVLILDEAKLLESVKARIDGGQTELAAIDEQNNPPLSIAGAWPAFKASQNRPRTGKATMEVYELTWGRFQTWMGKNHPEVATLRDITKDIAEQYAASLITDKRSPGTFNKYMNLLSLVFRTVSEKARLTFNPWANPNKDGHGKGIQRMENEIHGRRELTMDELQAVCDKAKDDLRLMLAIGIYTGLRLGDASTLRWGEVDLLRGIIRRIPNKTGRKNPKPVIIPIHPALRAMLGETPKADRKGDVLPRIASDYRRHSSYVTDRVQALFDDCKIQTTRKIEGRHQSQVEVGFHSLRHSFVSMCSENKVPLSVVQGMIGHSNPSMTRHYDHAEHEVAKASAIASLPSFNGEPVKVLPPAKEMSLIDVSVIRELESMTAKNWEAVRDELLAIVKNQ